MRTVWLLFAGASAVGAILSFVGSLSSTHEGDMAMTQSLALTGMALGALALSRTESRKDGSERRG